MRIDDLLSEWEQILTQFMANHLEVGIEQLDVVFILRENAVSRKVGIFELLLNA